MRTRATSQADRNRERNLARRELRRHEALLALARNQGATTIINAEERIISRLRTRLGIR